MSTILAAILLIVGVINMIIAVSVFVHAPRDRLRWALLFLVSCTAVWAWGVGMFLVASSADYAQFYANIYYCAAMAIAGGLMVFGAELHGKQWWYRVVLTFMPCILLVVALLNDPHWLISVVTVGGSLSQRVEINLAHYTLYGIAFTAAFGYAWWSARTDITSTRRHKRQQRIVSVGVIVAGAMGMLFNLILPWVGNYEWIAVGPMFSLLFTFSIAYASVKYSMFDLRRTFSMSLAYIFASSMAALLYMSAVWAVSVAIADGVTSKLVVGITYTMLALLVATTITPLKTSFDKITAKLFLREQYNPEEALDSFGDAILDDTEVASIADKAGEVIGHVIHPEYAAILLLQKGSVYDVSAIHGVSAQKSAKLAALTSELDRATSASQVVMADEYRKDGVRSRQLTNIGIAVIARMQVKDQTVGYIVVGEKRSGDSYSPSERLMLATMSDEMALAILNSQKFDEIQLFNTRLKSEIDSATRELRASNKKLLEMDATKDEFVSMASHQLRTPLTSVKGYISMVLEGDAGEISQSQRQLLEEAYTSSERMVHLIGDFLNVSRLQTGKFMIDRREVDLAKIVEQEIDSIRQIALTHHITITYKKPARMPVLYLDEGKMRQVIMNFIDNAIYYSPDNTPIVVKLNIEEGDAVLRVIDKGMGVPEEVQDRLFSRFFRAENARRQRPDGTGIGLYLAKKIIDGHKGKLVFESTLGKGSTFGFRLPVKKLSVAPIAAPDNDVQPKTTP
ncbi:MAG TPA: ATP-binding protein [Candidatus Saccharimonas sp.]|jgi:signal transduction histidine kinase|nr:ATP-binding protein [Candidatus Saccharimonas sp.]